MICYKDTKKTESLSGNVIASEGHIFDAVSCTAAKDMSLQSICNYFSFSFMQRDFPKLLFSLNLLRQRALDPNHSLLSPFFNQYHIITICLEMFKMTEDSNDHNFIFTCLLTFTERDNSVSVCLESKGFISFSMKHINSCPIPIISTLSNISSVSKSNRNAVLSEFPISTVQLMFKNHENLREKLLLLLYNYSRFKFDIQAKENLNLLLLSFFIILKRELVFDKTLVLWGIHFIFMLNLPLLTDENDPKLPFSHEKLFLLIFNLKDQYHTLTSLTFSYMAKSHLFDDMFLRFNFLDYFHQFTLTFQDSHSKEETDSLFGMAFFFKHYVRNYYTLINQTDFFFFILNNFNFFPFSAKIELYKSAMFIVSQCDNSSRKILIENDAINFFIDGLYLRLAKCFLEVIEILTNSSVALGFKLDKTSILSAIEEISPEIEEDQSLSERCYSFVCFLKSVE